MKHISIAIAVLIIIGLEACHQQQHDSKADELTNKNMSPIESNWITVSYEQNGRKNNPKRVPQQFKVFHDGYFSLTMYDDEGKFYLSGAGPYEINGDMYKETFLFCSDTNFINCKILQKWEMKGDTLVFYGFEKAEMADGKDVTNDWNSNGKFIEKRVRVKK